MKANTIDNILEKIKAKTTYDETTGCWLYHGERTRDGHGRIQLFYRGTLVHRISAVLHGKLNICYLMDTRIWICHETFCPNKNCWNPEHIYVGGPSSNANDRSITTPRICCKNGHIFSEENTYWWNGERQCRECSKLRERMRRNGRID